MMPMPSHDVFRLMILSWYVANTGKGPKWIEGTVKKQAGPLSFVVSLTNG